MKDIPQFTPEKTSKVFHEMSPVLRTELEKYLSQLERYVFSEDTSYFDEQASRLIDCVHYLMEEGARQ